MGDLLPSLQRSGKSWRGNVGAFKRVSCLYAFSHDLSLTTTRLGSLHASSHSFRLFNPMKIASVPIPMPSLVLPLFHHHHLSRSPRSPTFQKQGIWRILSRKNRLSSSLVQPKIGGGCSSRQLIGRMMPAMLNPRSLVNQLHRRMTLLKGCVQLRNDIGYEIKINVL